MAEAIPGTYVRSLEGHTVFLPRPLPPPLALSPESRRLVEQATYLLGQVEMCRTLLPNADLLIYSSLQREALASSTIEGTIASPDELVLFQASRLPQGEAVREVANYVAALRWGYDQLKTHPIGVNLILGLHERLLQGVRGARSAGRFKSRQNYIGARPNVPIDQADFVPPPPDKVIEFITALERYINLDDSNPKVIQCALTHYQFETIHPFEDGNGRVGRLLIILQMIQLGLLSAPLIYPSVYFERNRDLYYRRLQDVREQGAWDEWVGFFAEGVCQQAHETIAFTRTILDLRERLHREIGNVRRRASVNAALDAFFRQPVLSVGQISEQAKMARNSVQAALDHLQQRGMVYEITGMQKKRVYACRPVLDAIFGEES